MDIEYIAQYLLLCHATYMDVFPIGTVEVLAHLARLGQLSHDDANLLSRSYEFIRRIESRLGLMSLTAKHDLPTEISELNRLAFLCNCRDGTSLGNQCRQIMGTTRRHFAKHFLPTLA